MPVRSLCQKFFRDAFAPFHQYRQRAILDATAALSRGASLTLTSIGRYLPGNAQVKNKIKRIDRLLGNDALHRDIPAIFQNITRLLTRDLTLCVIAIDWNGYPSQAFHVLRASLVCYRRSIPLMSQVVPSSRQQHTQVHKAFLDALAAAIWPDKKVIIITDAGFQSAWFRHVRSLGWDFIGRIRGNVQFRLDCLPERWLKLKMLRTSSKAKYLGAGTLVRAEYGRCEGHFYFHKRASKERKNQRARCRISRYSQEKAGREAAKEPWLIFSSTNEFEARKIMKLYSRRMQIEQNFRDEKSERFGFGLRASHSHSAGRLLVLSLLATLVTIVMWLLGYHAENKGLHLRYQANSLKSRRVISYLTLAENILNILRSF